MFLNLQNFLIHCCRYNYINNIILNFAITHFSNGLGNVSLSEALAEIKYLRMQISLRDVNIARLTLQVNELTGDVTDDAFSSHKKTCIDDVISPKGKYERNSAPIVFERCHLHENNSNNFADLFSEQQTINLVNSNHYFAELKFDR